MTGVLHDLRYAFRMLAKSTLPRSPYLNPRTS
jgi:hypothetical protein